MKRLSIGIIGSGNIAWSLGETLSKFYSIAFVHSRNNREAKKLSIKLHSISILKKEIELYQADIIFICLSDDVISTYLECVNFQNTILIHTSGSASIDVLSKYAKSYGVFYPVQSINKLKKTNWKEVPICIEFNNTKSKNAISSIANLISNKVYILNSTKRIKLHLAAVFANNFSNACFSFADEILTKAKIPFEIIKPLIQTTASNVIHSNPSDIQTGPAKRGDLQTIKKHIALLDNDKELQTIYKYISKRIGR